MYKINSFEPDKQAFSQIISNIANMPKRLWLLGNLPQTRITTVAVVGTRKPTPYGKEVTYQLSYELAKHGIAIVSGLALGVDGIAHRAALDAGGTTIAVLPSALDRIYPRTHQQLAHKIIESGGALVSEYEPGMPTNIWNFVGRNRIVTALSNALLITEATTKSGTLTTANFALEQGKPVMVVPGNITSSMSAGCNNLLKVGATPVTDVTDILHELGLEESVRQTALPLASSPEESAILKLLASGIKDGDALHEKSGLSAATFNQTMTMLEIEGKVRPLGANNWTARKK